MEHRSCFGKNGMAGPFFAVFCLFLLDKNEMICSKSQYIV
ncbi:hypothetical protein AVP43_02931 [Geobacillus stearothermophilus]|jgi:hypothetical protein|nr:hypothetical protein AVP43_02931 [Geobacillus stearothermophilus]STO13006.1 Uncharacterised protein [[Flavobacterium] thermophilum]